MTFSSEKDNIASEKFYFVRVTPARDVTNQLVEGQDANFDVSFPFKVTLVEENGVSRPFVQVDGTLTVTLNSLPSNINPVIVFYHIFYTSDHHRVIGIDPETPETDLQDWSPRLTSEPSVRESISNVINGKLSIASSPISIDNTDNDFGQYLTDDDSFSLKAITVWLCIDEITNIKKLFEGVITSLSLTRNGVTFNLKNGLAKLRQPAFMGDSIGEVYATTATNSGIDPTRDGSVIKYIAGPTSSFTNLGLNSDVVPVSILGTQFDDAEQATCTNFVISTATTPSTTSDNRAWVCCRSDTFKAISADAGTYSSLTGIVVNTLFTFTGTNPGIRLGDTVLIKNIGTSEVADFRCIGVDGDTIYLHDEEGTQPASFNPAVFPGNTFASECSSHSIGALTIITRSSGDKSYPNYSHYTETITTTSGGNKSIEITFDNDFENGVTGINRLTPETHDMFFRARLDDTNQTHGKIMKTLIDGSGSATNAASFAQVDIDLAAKTYFSIPNGSENDYRDIVDYSQDILRSTLGYLTVNSDAEIEYRLFSSPSASDDSIDNSLNLESSISVEYQDIITEVIAQNTHTTEVADVSVSNLRSERLHSKRQTRRIQHVLADISGRLTDILTVLSTQQITYTLATKSLNLESSIGDDLTLANDRLLGGVSTKNLLITSLSKGAKETKIKAIDLPTI